MTNPLFRRLKRASVVTYSMRGEDPTVPVRLGRKDGRLYTVRVVLCTFCGYERLLNRKKKTRSATARPAALPFPFGMSV